MTLTKRAAFVLFSTATAACALVAARYWYLSSLPNPVQLEEPAASISDEPALFILNSQASIESMRVPQPNKPLSLPWYKQTA
jgi:hypothetical protein